MIKIRMQGTTKDLKWFKKVLERNKKLEIKSMSEPMPNKGTKKYFRVYADLYRTDI